MIQIAICEDEMNARTELRTLVEECLENNRYSYRIYEFGKGEALLGVETHFHGIFLDIEMDGVSGLDVKEALEEKGSNTFIVFVTNHEEWMQEAFGENVLGFLKKPVRRQVLEKLLEKMIRRYRVCQKMTVKSEGKEREVEIWEILYISAEHVYVNIHLGNGRNYVTRDTLHIWEERLGSYGFCRIHKSYLINLGGIKEVVKHNVVMQDGTRLAVGRKFETDFLEKYHRYREDMASYV